MKKTILVFLFALGGHCSFAQPSIQWQKSLGGSGDDGLHSLKQTSDSGYIVVGSSYSTNGDVFGNHGGYDYWVVKLSSSGTIQWQKSLGGSQSDLASSVQQTPDGGYIVAGYSHSTNGDVTGHHGDSTRLDCWIVKLSTSGDIQWQKSLGGTGSDMAFCLQITSDGGYIVAGSSTSNDGDVSGNHGNGDYWIVKLNDTGSIQWQKSLGCSADDVAYSVQQTSDSGYVIAGMTKSSDGDVSGYHGHGDYWVVKLLSSGSIQWQRSLGGTNGEAATSIIQTSDGGYSIAGMSGSNDGDVSGNHGSDDYWIVKLSSSGSIQWQKSLGGAGNDEVSAIHQTADSGYIVGGYTLSNYGDVTLNHGSYDFWIVKLSTSGSIQWQKSLGGTGSDIANCFQETSDGGYIVAGSSTSNDGDVSGNHGSGDYWIVKLGVVSLVNSIADNSQISIVPNPTTGNIYIKGTDIVNIKTYNTIGQLIKETHNTDNISLSEFPIGMYLIRLFNNQGEMIYTDKIIKQ